MEKQCGCLSNECKCLRSCPFELGRFIAPMNERALRDSGCYVVNDDGSHQENAEVWKWHKGVVA